MVLFYQIWITILGLLIGSFLNVCIYRLPRGVSVAAGRSFCPQCGHSLAAADLIPVASYLLLGRRCRYCRAPIASRYAWIESLTAIAFGLAAFILQPDGTNWHLLQTVAYCLAFAASLVWIMIERDAYRPPATLLVFIALPLGLAWLLTPDIFRNPARGLVRLGPQIIVVLAVAVLLIINSRGRLLAGSMDPANRFTATVQGISSAPTNPVALDTEQQAIEQAARQKTSEEAQRKPGEQLPPASQVWRTLLLQRWWQWRHQIRRALPLLLLLLAWIGLLLSSSRIQ